MACCDRLRDAAETTVLWGGPFRVGLKGELPGDRTRARNVRL